APHNVTKLIRGRYDRLVAFGDQIALRELVVLKKHVERIVHPKHDLLWRPGGSQQSQPRIKFVSRQWPGLGDRGKAREYRISRRADDCDRTHLSGLDIRKVGSDRDKAACDLTHEERLSKLIRPAIGNMQKVCSGHRFQKFRGEMKGRANSR